MNVNRHVRSLLILVLVCAPALAACGDDGGSASAPTAAPAAADGPVTVEHAFGTTTVDAVPTRIVSLGTQWTDVLLAMDVQPVGYLADPMAGDGGIYPWETDLSADATPIEVSDKLPYEQIAALDPDLIVITYLAEDQATYDTLSAIAPTIPLLGTRQVDRWQDLTEVAGQVLGQPDKATATIADVERLLTQTASDLPGLAGKTFSLANYLPGDSIYVVADPEDGACAFFRDLGMVLDPEIEEIGKGNAGRAQLSLEQAGLLDSDLLVLLSNGGNPEDLVGYDQLPSVQSGAIANVEFAPVVGLNTPTPLSIPYSLEIVLPALEKAAAA